MAMDKEMLQRLVKGKRREAAIKAWETRAEREFKDMTMLTGRPKARPFKRLGRPRKPKA
jgi:hypothetical protein